MVFGLQWSTDMTVLRISESLWSSAMLPEGIVERWMRNEGETVKLGEPVAEVRIEDSLHEILAPAAGRLHIWAKANSVIDPGTGLGEVAI